jgi:hypothetical protein
VHARSPAPSRGTLESPIVRLEDDHGPGSPGWLDLVEDALEGADHGVQALLERAREHLGMDVAFVAESMGEGQVVRLMEGDGASFGLYIDHIIDGGRNTPQHAAGGGTPAEVEDGRGVVASISVPLKFSEGAIYGTLHCLRHSPVPPLGDADIKGAELIARLIADHLERRELEAANVKLRMESVAVRALLAALEARDGYTGEHSAAVVALSTRIGEALGLSEEKLVEVRQVATLHDIGKIGIPDTVLLKSGPLTPAERILMREHPLIGWRIVSAIPGLRHLAPAVRAEHECWDGSGYPDHLAGEHIPIASRIVLVADAYHAMVSDRPYRSAIGWAAAIEELRANAGGQFCPHSVGALIVALEERS